MTDEEILPPEEEPPSEEREMALDDDEQFWLDEIDDRMARELWSSLNSGRF